MANIPADVVGQAASTAATATQNAANLSQAPQSHWYDVWSETGSGMSQHSSDPEYVATHLAPGLGAIDSRIRMAQAVGRGWEHTDLTQMKDGMKQQAGALADQASQFWHGEVPDPSQPGGKREMTTLQRVGAAFGLLTSVEQLITMPFGAIPFPAFPALRVTDMDIGLPHAHTHPPNLTPPNPVPVPLPSTGPVIPIPFVSGASKVLINALPAARCGDMGLGVFCGGFFPFFEVFLGSANVWIEGSRAGRVGVDLTKHCIFSNPANISKLDIPIGAMFGSTVTSSANVMIGGVPMPSLTAMAIAGAFKLLFKGLGKLIGGARRWLGKGAEVAGEHPLTTPRANTAPMHAIPPPHGQIVSNMTTRAQEWMTRVGQFGRAKIPGITAGELLALTQATGHEWAVVLNKDGEMMLLHGSQYTIAKQMEIGDQVLVHTHPQVPGQPWTGVAMPSGATGDMGNAAGSSQAYKWDHPQAVIGEDGTVRYFDKNGVIQNPGSAMLPIDNAGNIDGVHNLGGDPNAPMRAIPPGMQTPGNPFRP